MTDKDSRATLFFEEANIGKSIALSVSVSRSFLKRNRLKRVESNPNFGYTTQVFWLVSGHIALKLQRIKQFGLKKTSAFS
jgi:hypothetical protein